MGFKVGGIPEQVPKDCGILVEPKDVSGLAKAIEELLENGKRGIFSRNCRQRTLENYTLDKFKDRYINLYKELTER